VGLHGALYWFAIDDWPRMTEFTLRVRKVALVIGPLSGLLLYWLLPAQYLDQAGQMVPLTFGARTVAAVGLWMAIWWMTEAIPVYVTALLPLAAFPLTGAASIRQTATSYGHEIIYLFLGGFILALALERWGLHRRLALNVLSRVGTRPTRIIGGFMVIAAFISMWVTNTATTIMLLPVALSIIRLIVPDDDDKNDHSDPDTIRNFSVCLLLGVAYAATVGGIGTIVGTAPNVFVVSFVANQMGREISFLTWMMFGVPVVLVLLPIVWWMLVRVVYPVGADRLSDAEVVLERLRNELGPIGSAEKKTLVVFLLTALAWVTRPLLNDISIAGLTPMAGLTDSGIAIIAALALFVTPVDLKAGEFLMDWPTAVRLPWGLLILFGGGLSLAAAIDNSGFSEFLGSRALGLEPLPRVLIITLVIGLMIFLTELTSNTATTATLIPVLFAIAASLGLDPYYLVIPAGIAASCAFMLPVATPPNAIVFGSGQVTIPQMTRAGFWLNIVSIILITALTYAVIIPVLGVAG
jgi:sodium-dependent dicarboxylate transporter 2/3/5